MLYRVGLLPDMYAWISSGSSGLVLLEGHAPRHGIGFSLSYTRTRLDASRALSASMISI